MMHAHDCRLDEPFARTSPGVTAFRVMNAAIALAVCMVATGCAPRAAMFASPEQAASAFVDAVRSDNIEELHRILGREGEDIISSGDAVADQQARSAFLRAYDRKNSIVDEPDGSRMLQVGDDDWPMPIPLVPRGGSWFFDARRGQDEILNRRIGRNELYVQNVCLAIVDAQREYSAVDRNGDGVLEYARKVMSDPGTRDGLYWETGDAEAPSPLGELVAEAMDDGYGRQERKENERRPFHGYYFKLLTSQGPGAPGGARDYIINGKMTDGFAVVAWPAEYGNSGVMSFMVSHHGLVYECDLGRNTNRIASAISRFDPDSKWHLE